MSRTFQSICVFCGSSYGNEPHFKENARKLGEYLAKHNIKLIFGGSNVGLMGEVSQSVMANGGEAIGIIPQKIFEKVSMMDLTDLQVVETMHERKAKMHDLSDAFIALPGGIGTLEELTETMTWSQIGYHEKPIGLLNINHFYDPFIHLLQHMSREGFYNERYMSHLMIESSPEKLIKTMETYDYKPINKWDD